MYEERVEGLRETVGSLPIKPEHRDLIDRALDMIRVVYTGLTERSHFYDQTGSPPPFEGYLSSALEQFREALAASDDETLMQWAERAVSGGLAALDSDAALREGADAVLDDVAARAASLRDRISLAVDLMSFSKRVEISVASIEESQAKAQVATGEIGENSFVKHFADHARNQRNYAEALRWSTVALVAGVTAFAILGEHPAPGDWVGLISRGAVIAGITAIAAYLARQSGQHRRTAEWARSVEIQLRTFPAFVEGVSEEDRSFILRQLAARILASPPARSASTGEDSVSYAQVLDVVSSIARKTT